MEIVISKFGNDWNTFVSRDALPEFSESASIETLDDSPSDRRLVSARQVDALRDRLGAMQDVPQSFIDSAMESLARAELEEQAAGRGVADVWSQRIQEELLANRAEGLMKLIASSVTIEAYLKARDLGARDFVEAVSCIRLDVEPSKLDLRHARADLRRKIAKQTKAWLDAGFNRAEAYAHVASPFDSADLDPRDPEIRQFAGSNLSARTIGKYLRLGLPFTADFRPGAFTDCNAIEGIEKLYSGIFNAVFEIRYRTPQGIVPRIFKLARDRALIEESLASSRLDRLLGFGVIVPTEIGIAQHNVGLSMAHAGDFNARALMSAEAEVAPDGRLKSLLQHKDRIVESDRARRQLARKFGVKRIFVENGKLSVELDWMKWSRRDPMLQEKLCSLQIHDYLIGQVDRHAENYVVRFDEMGRVTSLLGVDNDEHNRHDKARRSVGGLPPVIDEQQQAKIRALTPQHLHDELGALLRPGHMQSLRGNLVKVRHWARHKAARISSDDWGNPHVTALLMNSRSMLSRHCA